MRKPILQNNFIEGKDLSISSPHHQLVTRFSNQQLVKALAYFIDRIPEEELVGFYDAIGVELTLEEDGEDDE